MKITGTIIHNGLPIPIDEFTMDQLIFQHKDGKTQLLLTTLINGESLTFQEDQIEELKIVQITSTDTNTHQDWVQK